jgi:arylformamidase
LPAEKHCRNLSLGYLQETPMADMDYEAEYNNRARVPEHEQIILGWAREAENYRADALKEGRAELGLAYGDTPRQTLDLFMPQPTGRAPLALFIHGGYWRSLDPSLFSHVARGLNEHGVAVAVTGYDLCPIVTIADIIVQIRRACIFLWQRLGQRMLVYGWSAGGHLTACMVATDWQSLYHKAPADLVPTGYAVSGIYDLDPLLSTSANQDLRLDADRARRVSPLFWPLPQGRTFDTAVGALESSEFRRQSRTVADAWQNAGAQTGFVEIASVNHFTIVGVLADAESAMVARVAQMAQAVKP